MRILFLLLLLPTLAMAQNCQPDVPCQDPNDPNVTIVVPSQATLDAEAKAQAIIDAQKDQQVQQDQIIQDEIKQVGIERAQSDGYINAEVATAQTSQLTTLSTIQATPNVSNDVSVNSTP